jgi:hypothetical protein
VKERIERLAVAASLRSSQRQRFVIARRQQGRRGDLVAHDKAIERLAVASSLRSSQRQQTLR